MPAAPGKLGSSAVPGTMEVPGTIGSIRRLLTADVVEADDVTEAFWDRCLLAM